MYPLWFFQAKNLINKLILPNLVGRIFYILIGLNYVHDEKSLFHLMLAQSICYLTVIIYTLFYFKKIIFIKNKIQHRSLITRFLDSFNFFIAGSIFNYIYTFWGILVIFLGSPLQISIFHLSDTFLKAGIALLSGFSESMISIFSKRKIIDIKHLFKIFLTISLIFFVGELSLDYLTLLFFGDKYISVIPIFKIILVLWFLLAIFNLLNYPIIGVFVNYSNSNKIMYFYGFANLICFFYHSLFLNVNIFNIALTLIVTTFIFDIYIIYSILFKNRKIIFRK